MTAMTLAAAGAMGENVDLSALDGATITQITYTAGTANASAGAELQSDGDIAEMRGNDLVFPSTRTVIGKYFNDGSGLEVRWTQNSGDAVTGSTLNTWLALSTSRYVYLTDSGSPPRSKTANCTAEVRRGTTILDSATFTLNTQIDSL